MKTIIETFLCAINEDGMSYKRIFKTLHRFGKRPDEIVLKVAQKYGFDETKLVNHSTSWRYDTGKKSIVLTYIVVEEKEPNKGFEKFTRSSLKSSSGTSTRPAPPSITELDVLCHGIRHIGHIINSHQWVSGAATRKFFTGLHIELAGEI